MWMFVAPIPLMFWSKKKGSTIITTCPYVHFFRVFYFAFSKNMRMFVSSIPSVVPVDGLV